jgi:glutamate 5-kinase
MPGAFDYDAIGRTDLMRQNNQLFADPDLGQGQILDTAGRTAMRDLRRPARQRPQVG